jgi:hypothetical protein
MYVCNSSKLKKPDRDEKSATGTSFSLSIRVCSVSIIPPYIHTHPHLHVTVKRIAKGSGLGTFKKAMLFRQLRTIGWNCIFAYSLKLRCHQYNS